MATQHNPAASPELVVCAGLVIDGKVERAGVQGEFVAFRTDDGETVVEMKDGTTFAAQRAVTFTVKS